MAATTTNETFACPRCPAVHAWRPEFVGRVAKCACGHVLKVPNLRLRDEDDAPTENFVHSAPACVTPHCPSEPPILHDGFAPDVEADLAAGHACAEADPLVYNHWKDFQLPLGLIALGLLPSILQLLLKPSAAGFVAGVVAMSIVLLVNLILMLGGVLLASKFAAIHFGELKPAILKLTAVYIGPSAVGQLLTALLGGDIAVAILGHAVSVILYWCLISYLFRLDGQQTMICVFTIGAVRVVTSMCLLTTLMAAIGSFMGTGADGIGAGDAVEVAGEPMIDD